MLDFLEFKLYSSWVVVEALSHFRGKFMHRRTYAWTRMSSKPKKKSTCFYNLRTFVYMCECVCGCGCVYVQYSPARLETRVIVEQLNEYVCVCYCVYVILCLCRYVCLYKCLWVCVCMHVYAYIHRHICVRRCACMHMFVCKGAFYMCARAYVCTHVYLRRREQKWKNQLVGEWEKENVIIIFPWFKIWIHQKHLIIGENPL